MRQRPVIGARNSVLLGPTSSTYAVLPLDITSADLTYHYSDLQQEFRVPIAKGDILSSVEVWYNGINVAQAQLQAMNTVTAVSFDDDYSQQKPDNGWIWWVILIVVGAVFAVFIVLAVLRRLNRDVKKAAAKKRSRGYRRSRRRSR